MKSTQLYEFEGTKNHRYRQKRWLPVSEIELLAICGLYIFLSPLNKTPTVEPLSSETWTLLRIRSANVDAKYFHGNVGLLRSQKLNEIS